MTTIASEADVQKPDGTIERSHNDDVASTMITLFCVRYSLIVHKNCPIIALLLV